MDDQNFSGKVVVITGAAAGIGRATAVRFAQSGANIAGWDVSDNAAAAFETDILAAGGKALFQVVNVADPGAVDVAVSECWRSGVASMSSLIAPASCATRNS